MNYPRSNSYDPKFIKDNLMGPNAMKLLEEVATMTDLPEKGLVLDLGCGAGLTSIFLADQLGYQVMAADLWISPTDNLKRFRQQGLEPTQVIPISAEAHELPFAEDAFDMAVSIDAYQYFGCDGTYLNQHLLPLVKKDGIILIVVPGVKDELGPELPEPMALSWTREDVDSFHSIPWWRALISKAEGVEILFIEELTGFKETWQDWLTSDNPHAVSDRPALEAGADAYMNLIGIGLRKL